MVIQGPVAVAGRDGFFRWAHGVLDAPLGFGRHIANIFTKLDLYPGADANRRVLAVLTYLNT